MNLGIPDEGRPKSPTPSDISELSAFKNLTLMLEDTNASPDLTVRRPSTFCLIYPLLSPIIYF